MTAPSAKAVAVIFARGTGDAVPFLSARVVAERPLIHRTIDAVRQAKNISAVYVSTEDERIADAARTAGIDVLLRPADLSQHETPINEAVDHAARELRKKHPQVDFIVGIPGDAIFVSPESIDQAVDKIQEGDYQRVVSIIPEFKKYVIWRTTAEGKLNLVVAPPHLRKKTEKHYSEPGIVTAWRIDKNDHITLDNNDIGYIEITERSAFRVDTEHDLHIAEKLIGPKRLALRCDGSPSMGMGHVMRLLNIASHLQENKGEWIVRVFVGSDFLEGAKILAERGIDVDVVRSNDIPHWISRIEAFAPQIVITDMPFIPAEFSEKLCDLPAETICLVDSIADLDPKTRRLDTVISLLDEELPYPCRSYHRGANFAALHTSVTERIARAQTARVFKPEPLDIVLAFGTGDPLRLTEKTMRFLLEEPALIKNLTLVLKKEHQDSAFQTLLKKFPTPPNVITSPSDRLGEILESCDAAIVSGGITAYEASALGAPTVVLCQNKRELQRMQQFERAGSILLLGQGESVTSPQLLRTLRRLSKDPALREKLSAAGLKVSDGRGLERISSVVSKLLGKTVK